MKKVLALLASIAMVSTMVVGCSSTSTLTSTAASTAAASTDTYKIYLITMDQMDQHWVNMDKGCKKAVTELGNVEYKWSAPDVKDDAKQIECINNAVADGAKAILLAANGPDADVATIKAADKAGVKIIYVDSPANFDGIQTLATDNTAAGKTAGEEMLKALKTTGVTSGNIGIINTNAATTSTAKRETGFRSAFDGSQFKFLATQYSEGDAAKSKDIAANYISQGCVGIFGTNEGTTVGTGNAIKEAGTKVIGVGFDKSDMILNLVKDGSILCTMAQNPDVMGYEGIKTAVNALQGKDTGEKTVDTGVTVLNKSNVK